METIKLQKYLALSGLMSRRAAETEIAAGKVTVNGVTATLGDRVDPDRDTVVYNNRTVRPTSAEKTYIMLNKPAGVVTTMKDEEGRRSVADLVSDVPARVYPVGRLDMFSEGLLIMTDDGDLCQALSHPRSGKEKVYRVTFPAAVSDEVLDRLSSPMTITEANGRPYRLAPCPVRLVSREEKKTEIEMILKEGRNRQIRRMCEVLGLKISRLVRIAEGGIELGTLPKGKWRRLTDDEINLLRSYKEH